MTTVRRILMCSLLSLLWFYVEAAVVDVDFKADLCMNDDCSFERDKFVNMHYNVFNSELDDEQLAFLMDELDVGVGRNLQGPLSTTPGFSARPSFSELRDAGRQKIERLKRMESRRIYDTRFKIVGDNYRAFEEGRKDVRSFIRHASWFFETHFDDSQGVMMPRYYEVANEVMVKWNMFGNNERETLHEIAEFMGGVCCGIKETLGKRVMCGGPAAAFPHYQRRDFEMWKLRVHDFYMRAGRCIDFWSQHFYDLDGGILEAIMDSVNSFTVHHYGKIYPQVVSEFGAFSKAWFDKEGNGAAPPTASRDWAIIHKTIGIMMQLMKRPDQILKTVAFVTGKSSWTSGEHPYPWAMLKPAKNGSYQWTPLLDIFKAFKDVKGEYRRSHTDDCNLVINAIADDTHGYLLIKNSVNRTINVKLRHINGAPRSKNLLMRRLYLNEVPLNPSDREQELTRSGTPVFKTTVESPTLAAISMKPEEMVVLIYEFESPPKIQRRVTVTEHFTRQADLMPFRGRETLRYRIANVPNAEASGSAWLKLGISRRNGLSFQANVVFNGESIAYEAKSAPYYDGEWMPYWAMVKVPIRRDLVAIENRITISFNDDEPGWISSVILELETIEATDGPAEDESSEHVSSSVGTRNLVTNGGFEHDLANWEHVGRVWLANADSNVRSGGSAVALREHARIEQQFNVKPGKSYIATVMGKAAEDGARLEVELQLRGAAVRRRAIESTVFSASRTVFPVKVNSTTGTIVLRVPQDGVGGYFDAVRVEEVLPIDTLELSSPVPTSLSPRGTISVTIDYHVRATLDVVVFIRRGSNYIAGVRRTVNAGASTITLPINLGRVTLRRGMYDLVACLRQAGGNYTSNVFRLQETLPVV
ncbi:hypothetical protein NDN08_000604 [Rhodosorus marinus]|uniref:Beta-porphyranase A C-terminal domain-containing protein n=1 Tax=Rhodosorus marinus TaxID=101924 RepID=A0AAV8UNG3_9RHOD|nr:hypothetical protein NDN08_000604 [Rhodosorus marinus]